MNDNRPDPDVMLERVVAEETTRGRLKIYLGMSAGAGKTFAMLSDANVERTRGVDVVVGYVEAHGRIDTERLAEDFESIPIRAVKHRGLDLHEFNLDLALQRKPTILLVDELAHTNAPGSRHEKRWQDIEECLQAGSNVYTTVNVQHVESLSDVVERITGVRVTEIVPDTVIHKAEEIELIDITPEQLTQRIREGKVYLKEKAEIALNSFFKPGNLMALRELVLRLTAERVDKQLATYRRQHGVREVWPAKPRILVCVTPNFLSERVVKTAARMAGGLQTDLIALAVESQTGIPLAAVQIEKAETSLDLAQRLGALIVRRTSDNVVAQMVSVAREFNANIVVLGRPLRSRFREFIFGSIVDSLIRQGSELDVYVISDNSKSTTKLSKRPLSSIGRLGFMYVILLVGVTTGICIIAAQVLDISNLVMFYLLAVTWSALKIGKYESITTAILSVLAFDFFFVPPRYTFAIDDVQYLFTFLVMLIIGLSLSTMTTRLHAQAELVVKRERRTASLYSVSKQLANVRTADDVARVVNEKLMEIFGVDGLILYPKTGGVFFIPYGSRSGFENETNELAVARWVSERKVPAGSGTMTLSGAKGFYTPVKTSAPNAPVIAVRLVASQWDGEQRSLFEGLCAQVGSTLERLNALQVATKGELEVEREKVRNLLLRSVSHDFRTPLFISAAAENLQNQSSQLSEKNADSLAIIRKEVDNLSRMVRNVLDITRVESGELKLNLEWEAIEEIVGSAIDRTNSLLVPRTIKVRWDSNLPLLHVDATLLVQVFVNLLENAAYYTPENTTIQITGTVDSGEVVVSVGDNGPGFPVDTEGEANENLSRRSGDTKGFGLGLAFCAAVLKTHGGRMITTNQQPAGSLIQIILPIPEEQPEVINGR
jgi:two-component system sensor histidine kinase KdpD